MTLRTANILLAAGLIALAIFVAVDAQGFSPRAAELPRLLVIVFLVVAIVLLAGNLSPKGPSRVPAYPFRGIPWKIWFGTVAALILLGLGAANIGFYESAFLFLLVTTWIMSSGEPLGVRRMAVPFVYAFLFDALLYAVFARVLHIPTPPGILL